MMRIKDLFYNIRVYSSVPIKVTPAKLNFQHTQVIDVPNCQGGGVATSSIFYKNPQFRISVNRDQVVNWAAIAGKQFETLLSYSCNNNEANIKAFLCHSAPGKNQRVLTIDNTTVVDPSQKDDPYRPKTYHVR